MKKKWRARLNYNELTYSGGSFENQKHAAMSINLLCDKHGIERKNPTINIKTEVIQQARNITARAEHSTKFQTQLSDKNNTYHSAYHDTQENVDMSANLLCDNLDMKHKNPIIDIEWNATQIVRNQTSNYIGVSWITNSNKWKAEMTHNGKRYYGGSFDDEEDAAAKINQLCDISGIERKNSIDILNLNKIPQKEEKISHYKGVTWHKKSRKWYVSVYHKGHKRKYGGMFNEELDAAKRVNQICEELNITPQNPNIQQSSTDDELLTSEEKEDEDFITEFLAGEQNTLKKIS